MGECTDKKTKSGTEAEDTDEGRASHSGGDTTSKALKSCSVKSNTNATHTGSAAFSSLFQFYLQLGINLR